MSSEAFVTLATTDAYALGALTLAESIRKVGTQAKLVVLISNHLSDVIKEALQTSFDEVTVVEELNSNDAEHLRLLARPELGITFTKINCWLLEQYSKCVFLDSDCLVLRPIDDLFQREEFSAAPDAGWPDCFNSGVFVYRPSRETFRKLMEFSSQENASFDGGDQGLLNDFFSDWRTGDISRHLPFTYNVTANAFYSYLPAVTRFRNDIHIVHFAGATKPWQLTYNPQNEQLSGNLGGHSDVQRDFLLSWWRVMYEHVWPKLSQFNPLSNANNQSSTDSQNVLGQFAGSFHYATLTSNEGVESGSAAHRRAWEAGHIDYFGRDSFSNIQQQLQRNIAQLPQQYHPSQQRQITPEKTTTPTPLKPVNKETLVPLQQITNLPQPSLKPTTPLPVQPVTKVTTTVLKEVAAPLTVPPQSQPTTTVVKEVAAPLAAPRQSQPTPTVTKNVVKEVTPPSHQPVHLTHQPVKQTVPLPQTTSLLGNTQPLLSSTLPSREHATSSHTPESNWTVKSTIVTAYTQGVGPTHVSKVVSETCASSSDDVPVITSIKEKIDTTIAPANDLTAKTTNDHFAWLFEKLFIAITYTISLCYLVFLVAVRRSKNSSIIHDNGPSIRDMKSSSTTTTTTTNGTRVNK